MALSTKAIGEMIWPTTRADLSMQMETFMRVSGSMTRHTVEELTFILMVPNTQVNGWKTNSMATVLRPGQMVHATKVITSMVKSMALEPSNGPIHLCSLENFSTTTFTV